MTEPDQPPIIRVTERRVFSNKYITVNNDDVLFGGVEPGNYLRIVEGGDRPGAAVLARSAHRYALVLTYRYPIGAYEWGIPRGFAESDEPEITARTELGQELGGQPRTLTKLGVITPNSGLLAGASHLFLGEFDEEVSTPGDTREVLKVRWLGLAELMNEIAEGLIADAFTLSAVALASAKGLLDADRR